MVAEVGELRLLPEKVLRVGQQLDGHSWRGDAPKLQRPADSLRLQRPAGSFMNAPLELDLTNAPRHRYRSCEVPPSGPPHRG
eukprot:4607169-Prymnesium_polylepis.1